MDETGCKLGCSVMSDVSQDNHFVVGRDDVSCWDRFINKYIT